MGNEKEMRIVIDVSSYQDSYPFEKFKLLIDSGVDAVIIRAGCYYTPDRMLDTFVEWCRRLRVPYGLYWYFYPQTNSGQAEKFIEVARLYPDAQGLWLDVEEHTGKESYLDAFYKTEFTKIKNAFPVRLVGIYSGGWVVDTYIPNMYKWAGQLPYWDAHYIKYYTWWQKYVLGVGSISKLKNIMEEISRHPVGHAAGFETLLWQCITYIPFTELTYWQRHLDWNICSDENFIKLFGEHISEPLPQPVISKYKVNTYALTIRATPPVNGILGKVVGWLLYGQVVEVIEVVNGWANIGRGWVSERYLALV